MKKAFFSESIFAYSARCGLRLPNGLILNNRRTGYHPYGYRPGGDGWPNWYQFFTEVLGDWQRWRQARKVS